MYQAIGMPATRNGQDLVAGQAGELMLGIEQELL